MGSTNVSLSLVVCIEVSASQVKIEEQIEEQS
jgi:hypothetical protein